jgi:AcrR family transcriptional regulator
MQPKRRSNVERRQESTGAVLDAALDLFVSQGYQATTTAEIAGRAGLTKGALYFYFKDKLALLTELLDRSDRQLYRVFFEQLEAGEQSAEEKIVLFLNWLARIAVENREDLMLPLLISLEFHGQDSAALEAVDRLRQLMKSQLVHIIEQGQADGSLKSEMPPESMADTLMAFADGLLLQWYRHESDIDGEAMARAARTTILQGIRA